MIVLAYILQRYGIRSQIIIKKRGYAFTEDISKELVEKFINQTFTQRTAILKIKFCNPKKSIVQHLPVKERVNKTEVNRMRNG